jgi:hypothetical protein
MSRRASSSSTERRLPFRFDAIEHAYYALDTGEQLPHITGMLLRSGEVDDRWFTEEARDRGGAVHIMTAEYDLGALDLAGCVSEHKGHLLAWDGAIKVLGAEFLEVEVARVHRFYRYGGRPDRLAICRRRHGVVELKTGARSKSHGIQTALQCMLLAEELQVPAPSLARWVVYTRADGTYRIDPLHEDSAHRRDFDRALEIIKETC